MVEKGRHLNYIKELNVISKFTKEKYIWISVSESFYAFLASQYLVLAGKKSMLSYKLPSMINNAPGYFSPLEGGRRGV